MQLKRKVVIDPLGLGCAQKRRRLYIIIIHKTIVVSSVKTHRDLESSLQHTIKKLKVVGLPPEPLLARNRYVKVCQSVCPLILFISCTTYLDFLLPRQRLMFPDDHPEVLSDIKQREAKYRANSINMMKKPSLLVSKADLHVSVSC